jgi:uncharacterized protein YraI
MPGFRFAIPGLLRRFRFLIAGPVAIVVAALLLAGAAHASIQPGPGKAWLTIASRASEAEAVALARSYAARFPSAIVFQSINGYYAVTLGWAERDRGEALRQSLAASGAVPADAYFHNGERFIRTVWSAGPAAASGDPYSGTYLLGGNSGAPPAPKEPPTVPIDNQPGYVTGLDPKGDGYLSLRLGPGANFREILRMRPDTPLVIRASRAGWLQVTLSGGQSGWASAKYIARGIAPADFAAGDANVPMVGPEKRTGGADVQSGPAGQSVNVAKVDPSAAAKSAAKDQKRVALVIGNAQYRHATELPNPKNDANAMAGLLAELGFTVVTALDAAKADMEGAVREFVKALPGADIALFFYAGHGMQVAGTNYLIPVDAKLEDSTALDFETMDLNLILGHMNADNRISIALLDACRDNPLSRRFSRSLGSVRSASVGRGLAVPLAAGGEMLIGFATAPGEVAQDGTGRNSPFTTALLKHMATPGLEIELMLKRVKEEVYNLTDRAQEPWHNSGLRREFYFAPGQ